MIWQTEQLRALMSMGRDSTKDGQQGTDEQGDFRMSAYFEGGSAYLFVGDEILKLAAGKAQVERVMKIQRAGDIGHNFYG